MKRYENWDDYLASEQDAYLDSENAADCDVQFEADGIWIYGKTDIHSYEICTDCETICILTDADESDLQDALDQIRNRPRCSTSF